MDPTVASGALLSISALNTEAEAFDVIGWDLATVPEPGTMALCATAIVFPAYRRKKAPATFAATPSEGRTEPLS